MRDSKTDKSTFRRYFHVTLMVLILGGPWSAFATDVRLFGAKGDGKTDDTKAIMSAIAGAADGLVEFPKGKYKISRTIEIDLAQYGTLSISGSGGTGSVLMTAEGPAFRFIGSHDKGSALPSTVKPVTWEKERMPLVQNLEIVGEHPDAGGLEFRNTMQPTIKGVLIRNVRTGIHFTSRNRNVIIEGSHIYNTSGVGIFLDKVDIHQFIISGSHISYCKGGGIKVWGSGIRNFQITGNDIEYNCDPEGEVSADIFIDCSAEGSSVREGTIASNTIQAIHSPGGANIRFIGRAGNPNKVGLWSVTGNHIGNQEINIHLDQARGINITGNNFMRGYDRNIIIENSKNILVSDNVIDRNEDYYLKPSPSGGIVVRNTQNILVNGNILDGIESGNEQEGSALVIRDCRQVTISDNQVVNPKFYAVQIGNSEKVMVTDNIITEDPPNRRMLAGIWVSGKGTGTIIHGNHVDKGTKGDVLIDE